jgi:hypothetical protein
MDAHRAEIVAESRLHETARLLIERLTRGAQHIVHDRWNPIAVTLQAHALSGTLVTFASPMRVLATGAMPLQHPGGRVADGHRRFLRRH